MKDNPQDLAELRRDIKREVRGISGEMCGKIFRDTGKRAELCHSKGVFVGHVL